MSPKLILKFKSNRISYYHIKIKSILSINNFESFYKFYLFYYKIVVWFLVFCVNGSTTFFAFLLFPSECGNAPADIHFLLDVSGSLETANFLKQLEFVKNFARSFTIDPNHVQIGITTFSTTPHPQFWLNTHQTNAALLAAIDKIQYPYG